MLDEEYVRKLEEQHRRSKRLFIPLWIFTVVLLFGAVWLMKLDLHGPASRVTVAVFGIVIPLFVALGTFISRRRWTPPKS